VKFVIPKAKKASLHSYTTDIYAIKYNNRGPDDKFDAVSCAKAAEPIEMPFGTLGGVGPMKHVLEGGPDPHAQGQF